MFCCYEASAESSQREKKNSIEMSIVIFGMWGTSESQGLPPGRDVKRKGARDVRRMCREEGLRVCV